MMMAPQPEPSVAIGSRFAGQIVTILELILAFIGGLLAVGTIRLVARGLRSRPSEGQKRIPDEAKKNFDERTITLHERK